MELQIHHIGERENRPVFMLVRSRDGKRTEGVCLPEPGTYPVKNHPSRRFPVELCWYLEEYLQAPFGAYPQTAACVTETMRRWGQAVFDTLFTGRGRDWYQEARRAGLEYLQLKIVSDSAAVLSWPWEALYSMDDGFLALRCHMKRQLSEIGDPLPLSCGLSDKGLHILYILARPYGEEDVGYHSLAGRFVKDIRKNGLCAHVDVLRPPTFDRLRQVLDEKQGYYHIIHFDGHGGYGEDGSGTSRYLYNGPEGHLLFETEDGKPEGVSAEVLAQLLAEYRIPVVVMNACRSGMIDEQAQDPFASVAAGLLKAGVRSVVAMGYSLSVSGAKEFVPAFYKRLFASGRVSEAVRAGRAQMFRQQDRACIVGKMPLQDWIVPVLYQQGGEEEAFLQTGQGAKQASYPQSLPETVRDMEEDGFIGRGRYLLKLERAVQFQKQAALLLHGQAGIGKTTLAGGYLRWLQDTGGLFEQVFWFDFREIHSAEAIVNDLLAEIDDFDSTAMQMEQKLPYLCDLLCRTPYIIVWDNFESASGIEGTEIAPLLDQENRAALSDLLGRLRGGETKILITSRTAERWLSIKHCYPIALSGLSGEELWEYCNAVVQDLGLTLDRHNPTYRMLLDKLEGNPLAIRAVLLRLQTISAEQLLAELETAFDGAEGDESTRRLQAACAVFGERLMERYLPVFQLTGLHERYIDADMLQRMLKKAGISMAEEEISNCFRILEDAGFCSNRGGNLYQMHPALRTYLLNRAPAPEAVQRAFSDRMSRLAYHIAGKQMHQAGGVYRMHLANFYTAKRLAERWDMDGQLFALLISLGYFAQKKRQFAEAYDYYRLLYEKSERSGREDVVSAACYQLGVIAQERLDFDAAQAWYEKALEIDQIQENEESAACIYHQLGMLAEEKRDFAAAQAWYQKSLESKEKRGDAHGAADTYHQLGVMAQAQEDFAAAKRWYQKSLEIEEKRGDAHSAAITCYQLGMLAEEKKDFAAAQAWYRKSLETSEKEGNTYDAARTYHRLGVTAQEQGDFGTAEEWYKKSLAINESQKNEHNAAGTYYQLGMIAQKRKEFPTAKRWYQKCLEIEKREGDEYRAACTYYQLGMTAQEQRDFSAAADFYLRSISILERLDDSERFTIAVHGYCHLLCSAPAAKAPFLQKRLEEQASPKVIALVKKNLEEEMK